MADGRATLQAQIARLRKLKSFVTRVAAKVATAAREEILAGVAQATGPDGKPWLPTEDGHKPLQNAGKALSAKAVGTVVLVELEGVEARPDRGKVRGGTRRPSLPTAGLPDSMARAIEKVVNDELARELDGGA